MGLKSGGVRGSLRNVSVAVPIPGSGDLYSRYDAREINATDGSAISSWADLANSLDLSATGDPIYRSDIGLGVPGVELDGTDDKLVTTGPTETQINHIFILARFSDVNTGSNTVLFDSESTDAHGIYNRNSTQTFDMNAGSNLGGPAADTNWHIWTAKFDGANSHFRLDGTQVASGDAGTESLNGITLGDFRGQIGSEGAVDIVEVLPYTTDKSGNESEIENYLDRDTNIL